MKKKAAVVYFSQYGATERDARWIAKETEAALIPGNTLTPGQLEAYDLIIWGGALYAGGIRGAKDFRRLHPSLGQKAVLFFVVGAGDPGNGKGRQEAVAKNFPGDMRENMTFFQLRGGMELAKLSKPHRAMIRLLGFVLSRLPKEKQGVDEQTMISASKGAVVDFVDRKSLRPLLDCALKRLG